MRLTAILALGLLTFGFVFSEFSGTPAMAAPPACNTTSEGMILYNKDHKLVQFCNGTNWISVVGSFGGGITDTLSGLSCTSGQVPSWNGTAWVCGAGGIWTNSGSGYLTYSATDTGVQVKAITGMSAPLTTMGDLGCTTNQIMKWDGDSWECAADDAGSGGDNLGDHIATTVLRSDTHNTDDLGTTAIRWKDGWFQGTVTGGTFAGSGASLTSLPAASLTGTLPAISGVNLTALNASNLGSGTVAAARMPALTGDVTMTAGTTVTNIAANTVGLTELSATGTADNSTFLRGDNTWATPPAGGTVPAGSLCGARYVSCFSNTPTYDIESSTSVPCNGSAITVTCAGNPQLPTITCPSGYAGGRLWLKEVTAMGSQTHWHIFCRKT